jgi:hypothetical protein
MGIEPMWRALQALASATRPRRPAVAEATGVQHATGSPLGSTRTMIALAGRARLTQ